MIIPITLCLFVASAFSAESSRYRIDVSATCCDKAADSTELMQCIDDIEPPEVNDDEKRIAMVSYASPDIIPYASYGFAVNSAYAEHNGYEIFFMSPETGSNYEPRDQRWNRVKILLDALDPAEGWLRDVDYIVWADADLIFLDFDFSMRALTEKYADSDIIISAERHAGTGVANTGCFIIKNSEWSREFLKDWWTSFDRTINHDQIFFDILYKRRMPEIAKHVKILPTDAINSTPPPMIHQKPDNKVLHLMGQRTSLRQKVFRLGFDEVCRAYEEKDDMAPQLGLTQPRLYSMALQYFETDLSRIVDILEDKEKVSKLSPEEFEKLTGAAREHVVQIQIYSPTQDNADIIHVLYNAAKTRALHAETSPNENSKYMPTLYNSWAVYGNDLLSTFHPAQIDERRVLSLEIEQVLNRLQSVLHPGQKHIATEMLLRLQISMGVMELNEKKFEEAASFFKRSLELQESMGDKKNDAYTVDALMNLGSALCMGADIGSAVDAFLDAIDVQEKLLFAEQQMKQDHLQLATIMLRASGCMAKGGLLRPAFVYSTRANEILSVHPEKDSADPLLTAWKRIDDRLRDGLSSSEDLEFMVHVATHGATPIIAELNEGRNKAKPSSKSKAGNSGSASGTARSSTEAPRKKKMMRKKKKSASASGGDL